jgi:hypothetical protein
LANLGYLKELGLVGKFDEIKIFRQKLTKLNYLGET